MQPPLLGDDTAGMQQANQALDSRPAKSGMHWTCSAPGWKKNAASRPNDIVTARMLAAVYEFGFSE